MIEELILDYIKTHGIAETDELLKNLDTDLETLVKALDALKEHNKIVEVKI